MKLQAIERNIESGGVLSEGDFGISQDDQAHVLTILRDKLYSDKFGAIVREYSTNAWDAHVEMGITDRPIKVQCPTRWEPTLSIRDFGKGLTRSEVYNVYCKYGRSTKRNSNDVIGQLGLGCKSGFAYNNTFTIVSHCEGMKTTYVAFIDQTGVGKVNELQSVPSDETGVEIQIAIRAADVDAIRDRIQKLYPYFNPTPDCNVTITKPEYSVCSQNEDPLKFWAIRTEYAGGPMAIMGNVPYPMDMARLPELNESGKEILQCGIDIRFPIGDLSISASREALEYTDTTRQAIYKRLAVVRQEILASLKTQFDNCANVWEARMLYQRTQRTANIRGAGYGYNSRNIVASLAANTFKNWQGKDIAASEFNFETHQGEKITVRLLDSNSKKATDGGTSSYRKRVGISQNLIVLKNDVKSAWLKRILSWRDANKPEHSSQPYAMVVIDWNGDDLTDAEFDSEINRYLVANAITGITIKKCSDIPLPEEVAVTPGTGVVRIVNPKAKAKVFTAIPAYNANEFPASKNWVPAEADLEEGKGVYVVIHGFLPVEETDKCDRTTIMKLLFALGHDVTATPIYGIRACEKDRVGEGWTELLVWGKEQARTLLANSPMRNDLINHYIANHFSLGNGRNGDSWKAFLDTAPDTRIKQAAVIISQAEASQRTTDWQTRQKFSTILNQLQGDIMGQISNSIKIIEDVEKDYPLLKELEMFHGGGYFRTTTWAQHLAKYVELMLKK